MKRDFACVSMCVAQVEVDGEKLSSGAHSSLLYDTWLVDVPKLLDICALYSAGISKPSSTQP